VVVTIVACMAIPAYYALGPSLAPLPLYLALVIRWVMALYTIIKASHACLVPSSWWMVVIRIDLWGSVIVMIPG